MPKVRYISRSLILGPYVGLCLSEVEFKAELKRLRIPDDNAFVKEGFGARTHSYRRSDGELMFLICMKPSRRNTRIQHYALLVHEAMHVWREWLRKIGEDTPSDEFEAYAVQHISQQLMEAFEGK